MAHELDGDIRYCITKERAAFLNLATDRYFCLPPELDKAFQSVMQNRDWTGLPTNLQVALLNTGIFTENHEPKFPKTPYLQIPTWDCWGAAFTGAAHLDHVIALFCYRRSKLDIRKLPLKAIIAQVAVLRERKRAGQFRNDRLPVAEAVARFRQIRALVKVHDQCLVWSLAMLRFLSDKHVFPYLVIGVRLEPFSAHAWLQHGDLVLSCPIEEAQLYTPILVV